jgi:hypothetical protein
VPDIFEPYSCSVKCISRGGSEYQTPQSKSPPTPPLLLPPPPPPPPPLLLLLQLMLGQTTFIFLKTVVSATLWLKDSSDACAAFSPEVSTAAAAAAPSAHERAPASHGIVSRLHPSCASLGRHRRHAAVT